MTALRDPFATVHKKDIKNKAGQVVAQVDYVGWSQSADRLDEVHPDDWSFSIIGIGPDWVHGRLTIGDRHFENIGYAENADADWKKEALKDAASDAFKRCAALAGVARYLYDKDNHSTPPTRPAARQPSPAAAAPTPIRRSSTAVPEPPMDWESVGVEPPASRRANGTALPPMSTGELLKMADGANIDKNVVGDTAKEMFGTWKLNDLTPAQRYEVALQLQLVDAP